jgi:hypothetical protein
MIVNVLGYTADSIATHLPFAAIRIEHAHASVSPFRGADEDQAIRTNTEVPVANLDRQLIRINFQWLSDAVDVHIIVADAVHLGELHALLLQSHHINQIDSSLPWFRTNPELPLFRTICYPPTQLHGISRGYWITRRDRRTRSASR